MDPDLTREDHIIAAYAAGDPVESITGRYGASRAEIEALVAGTAPPAPGPYRPPVTAGYEPAHGRVAQPGTRN